MAFSCYACQCFVDSLSKPTLWLQSREALFLPPYSCQCLAHLEVMAWGKQLRDGVEDAEM